MRGVPRVGMAMLQRSRDWPLRLAVGLLTLEQMKNFRHFRILGRAWAKGVDNPEVLPGHRGAGFIECLRSARESRLD